jgi:N-acetylneuraminic acid mutarotase
LKKLCLLIVIALSFLTVSCIFTVEVKAAAPVENTWQTLKPMSMGRTDFGVVGVDGKVFVIGGGGGAKINSLNEMYDPATNSWTTKQPMPTARINFGIAVFENKIFCIGGDPDGSGHGANEAYDTVTDSWTTKTAMPTPRMDLTANTVNGKIYLIGGSTSSSGLPVVNLNEVYDIATDTWSTKAPIPVAVRDYSSAVFKEKIYIIGGLNSTFKTGMVQIYDCASDSWSLGAPLPVAISGTVAVATSGVFAPQKIYVFGGRDSWMNQNFNYTWIYDPVNDFWRRGAAMPTERTELGAANVNDLLYVIGGLVAAGTPFSRVNECYTPFGYSESPLVTSPSSTGNSPQPTLPTAAIIAGVVVAATVIAVAGVVVFHFKHAPVKTSKPS